MCLVHVNVIFNTEKDVYVFEADAKGRPFLLPFVLTGQLTEIGRPNYLIH